MLPNQKLTETLAEQNQAAEIQAPIKKLFKFALKKNSKKSSSIDSSLIIVYIYPLTILIIIGILVWFFYFLYNNVYLTMAQAEVVSGLKVRVISEKLNKDKFNEIIKNINDKSILAGWTKSDILKSPFVLGARNNYSDMIATTTTTSTPLLASTTPLKLSSSTATSSKTTSTKK